MRAVLLVACVLFSLRVANADERVLGATPRDQALQLLSQAATMFEAQDFLAAAVTFGQAQTILSRIDRNASGATVDKEAHAYRRTALSNKATAYSRGNYFVEAFNAFVELRDQFAAELSALEREEIDDAIVKTKERIGSLMLVGLPAGELEVRIDGRLERRDLTKPLLISEGDHSIDVKSPKFRPYGEQLTIVRQQELVFEVKLEPLKTPARVRIESSVESTRVVVDGTARGDAPVEVSVAPGPHRIEVTSESYVRQVATVDLEPGERAILRVGMVRARAPLGLRLSPSYFGSFPLRADTPFGSYGNAVGLQLFHDALRFRTLRFGLNFEYHARDLNNAGAGLVGTWCPDRFAWRDAKVAWCPATLVVNYVFGDRVEPYRSGEVGGRAMTGIELRRGAGFVRVAAGVAVENYAREYPSSPLFTIGDSILVLWSSVAELSVGVDL